MIELINVVVIFYGETRHLEERFMLSHGREFALGRNLVALASGRLNTRIRHICPNLVGL